MFICVPVWELYLAKESEEQQVNNTQKNWVKKWMEQRKREDFCTKKFIRMTGEQFD